MWYNGVEESNMRNKDLISTISREEEERGRNNSVNGQKARSLVLIPRTKKSRIN